VGGFVCVPPGVVHTFSNRTDAAVRFLNFNTPAGWENYMRDLAAALAGGTPTREEIGRIASRYDFELA
jgi:cupin superfamily acireductone dioxygenase involved in methionine salvage